MYNEHKELNVKVARIVFLVLASVFCLFGIVLLIVSSLDLMSVRNITRELGGYRLTVKASYYPERTLSTMNTVGYILFALGLTFAIVDTIIWSTYTLMKSREERAEESAEKEESATHEEKIIDVEMHSSSSGDA